MHTYTHTNTYTHTHTPAQRGWGRERDKHTHTHTHTHTHMHTLSWIHEALSQVNETLLTALVQSTTLVNSPGIRSGVTDDRGGSTYVTLQHCPCSLQYCPCSLQYCPLLGVSDDRGGYLRNLECVRGHSGGPQGRAPGRTRDTTALSPSHGVREKPQNWELVFLAKNIAVFRW